MFHVSARCCLIKRKVIVTNPLINYNYILKFSRIKEDKKEKKEAAVRGSGLQVFTSCRCRIRCFISRYFVGMRTVGEAAPSAPTDHGRCSPECTPGENLNHLQLSKWRSTRLRITTSAHVWGDSCLHTNAEADKQNRSPCLIGDCPN